MISRDAVRKVYGTDVYSADGDKIGSAGQVYLDNRTGDPAWVSVRTGLFGKKESFVPLSEADLSDDRLQVPFGKDKVKNAPQIDQDGELSPADEDELYRYYGSTRDESGPADNDDDAMTRSEERLVTDGTHTEPVGKARLRKHVVTEERQVTVPVTHEEVRLEQEPTGGTGPRHATDDRGDPDEEQVVTLRAQRPVVTTETVPVEQVRLGKQTVTDEETVTGQVRKERIELEDDTGR
jgi:uncharacterized protein (TIGR02271 family)